MSPLDTLEPKNIYINVQQRKIGKAYTIRRQQNPGLIRLSLNDFARFEIRKNLFGTDFNKRQSITLGIEKI